MYTYCIHIVYTCHNLPKPCHNLQRACHNLERARHTLHKACHNLHKACHNLQTACHNLQTAPNVQKAARNRILPYRASGHSKTTRSPQMRRRAGPRTPSFPWGAWWTWGGAPPAAAAYLVRRTAQACKSFPRRGGRTTFPRLCAPRARGFPALCRKNAPTRAPRGAFWRRLRAPWGPLAILGKP